MNTLTDLNLTYSDPEFSVKGNSVLFTFTQKNSQLHHKCMDAHGVSHHSHTHTPLYCPNFGASGEIRTVSPQHDDVGMDWAGGRISSIKLADAHALAISFQLVFVQCNRLVMTMQL